MKTTTKAARLVLLLEMKRAGHLHDLNLQEWADLLGAGHRSTIMRAMRDLPLVENDLKAIKEKMGICDCLDCEQARNRSELHPETCTPGSQCCECPPEVVCPCDIPF